MKRIAYRLFILLYLLCVPNMLWAIQVMYDTICWQPTYSFMGADYPLPAYQSHQNEKYMHVVLEYRDTIECEKYRLFLSIIPFEHGAQRAINDTIVNGETYDFFGQQLTAEGIPYRQATLPGLLYPPRLRKITTNSTFFS